MDRFWQTVNGAKALVALVAMFIAAVVWVYGLSRDVWDLKAAATARAEVVDKAVDAVNEDVRALDDKVDRIERNMIRLGARWNIDMEEPPARSNGGGVGGGGGGSSPPD